MKRLAGLALMAASCSSIRYSIAPMDKLRIPSLALEGLHGRHVALEIQDQRSEPEVGAELVATTQSIFERILLDSGTDTSAATDKLTIRIVTYRADFQFGEWTGCTEFLALLSLDGTTIAAPAEKCISHTNIYGYRTADEVLKTSYQDAVVDVVNKLQVEMLRAGPRVQPESASIEPAATTPLPAP